MKVLKSGRGDGGWSKKLVCTGKGNSNSGCGALLLVERTDLYVTGRTFFDGETECYTTFRCPECGSETDVDGAQHIQGKLPDKRDWMKANNRDGE